VSNECKNILGVKLQYIYFTSQLRGKKILLPNWSKNILSVKWE